MTSYCAFRALSFEQQLPILYAEGEFVANRYEEEDAVNLYRLPGGFFVELFYDQHENQVVRLRTFTSSQQLEDYTPYIDLSDLGL
ncbi:hypothetical protein [Hymenobacter actinosclerus]|uniref:Uncharacterized protein n=1 Tax=Hymenobacter actinosclerus TaxID=82805 RepID=A0A1I0IKY1_9BACT|nr:hypothetical protein [Hymenobacter actinosclerus]SET97667.1 hypothetical protein SAMN04487998_3362 [Hymenobacter actinosclerus]